jgi:hypothetical protein
MSKNKKKWKDKTLSTHIQGVGKLGLMYEYYNAGSLLTEQIIINIWFI